MFKKNSISNILIYTSALFTLLPIFFPEVYIFGINNHFLYQKMYHIYFIQLFIGTFLHGGLLHFFANSIFLYLFGNVLEGLIGKKKYIIFLIFTIIFVGVGLSFTPGFKAGISTVGISGFGMALLSYYTLELKSRNNPEYKGGITALIINIGIGLVPSYNISLYGHLFGAIAGIIFYIIYKEFFRRKMVGAVC